MDHIEKSLKEISDDFLNFELEKPENVQYKDKVKNPEDLRQISGVMKVGALNAQMHLKGEKVLGSMGKLIFVSDTKLKMQMFEPRIKNFWLYCVLKINQPSRLCNV